MNRTLYHSDLTAEADGAFPSIKSILDCTLTSGQRCWEAAERKQKQKWRCEGEVYGLLFWKKVQHQRNTTQNRETWRTEAIRDSKGEGKKEREQRQDGGKHHCKEHPFSFSRIRPCSMVTVAQGQTKITFNLPLAYLYPSLNAQASSKGLVSSWIFPLLLIPAPHRASVRLPCHPATHTPSHSELRYSKHCR